MIKVLIVEDEPLIQRGLLYKVNWLKYNCLVVGCANHGQEGYDKILQLRPDLVITDVRMPFMDGLAMLTLAKKTHDFEAVILSGFSEFDYAKEAISLGVHDYLLKPVNMEELEIAIEALTKKLHEKEKVKTLEKNMQVLEEILNIKMDDHKMTKYVLEGIEYIKENYGSKVTLKDVSDHLGISGVSLNMKFKEEVEYSFSEFLNRYRILKAIEMLRNDEYLVYEVAEKTGFSEYKYFSQVFKKHVGMSPKQFVSQ